MDATRTLNERRGMKDRRISPSNSYDGVDRRMETRRLWRIDRLGGLPTVLLISSPDKGESTTYPPVSRAGTHIP